jgi:hypothetical protein
MGAVVRHHRRMALFLFQFNLNNNLNNKQHSSLNDHPYRGNPSISIKSSKTARLLAYIRLQSLQLHATLNRIG